MALSKEVVERLRETERLKLEVREEFERECRERREKGQDKDRDKDFMASFVDGGPGGVCPNCEVAIRARWSYCPSCGVQVQRTCLWCSMRLPERDDLNFCPYCGKQP